MATTYGPWPGIITTEHDGDTLHVAVTCTVPASAPGPVDVGWDLTLLPGETATVNVDARTWGDNADELNTPGGKTALAYLEQLAPVGTRVTLLSHGWDKYAGRTDATLTLPDGRDLTTAMIAAHQAAPWNGQGTKPVTS